MAVFFVDLRIIKCENLQQLYSSKKHSLEKQLLAAKARFNGFSNARLGLLVGGFVLMYFLFGWSAEAVLVFIPLWLTVFYYLVQAHDKSEANTLLLKQELAVVDNELQVEAQRLANRYDEGARFINERHPFSADLDVFGAGSLFAYINRCATEGGQNLLAERLLEPLAKPEIEAMQASVLELKAAEDWRLSLQAALLPVQDENTASLRNIETPPSLKAEFLLKLYPALSWILGLLIIGVFWTEGAETGLPVLFGAIAINYAIVGLNRKISEPYFRNIGDVHRNLKQYKAAVELIKNHDWQSVICRQYADVLQDKTEPLEQFETIAKTLDMRKNQLAAVFLYSVSPFDLLALAKLKKWLSQNPVFFENMLNSIAGFEYLSTMGTLAYNHPSWTKPKILDKQKPTIIAVAIEHPLIPKAVANDYTLDNSNALSLITGSNMSGKSTFLRTLGLNTILAYAGSVVAAQNLNISEGILLFTYMRIKDSLLQNASTFKAEIDRLSMLIKAIKTEQNALLLVDEMLRGTNSEDKLKGSMAFMESIVRANTRALIATHDLRMTEIAEKYPAEIKNYFFEYQSENNELRFDYKIKPGICQSFNATELLRMAGLIL